MLRMSGAKLRFVKMHLNAMSKDDHTDPATLAELTRQVAALESEDVPDVGAEVQAAQHWLETFSVNTDPQFAGTATILASAYDVLITQTNSMPTIFTGRPFADACKDFSRVRLLFQHDPDVPIGIIDALWETDAGLWAKVRFSRTTKGEEIAQLCRDGALCEASIGFTAKASKTTKKEGTGLVRVVTKAELADVSVVTWGANPEAKIVEAAGKVGAMEYASWRTDLHEAEALMSKLDGKSTRKTHHKSAAHFDWIRGRELTHEEHAAQQESAFTMKLHRAIQRDPALARMETNALIAYVEAIG